MSLEPPITGGPGEQPSRVNPMIFIAGVSFMNAVAAMIVIPVLPRLIVSFTGDTASAAHYVGLFAALFALVQFLVSPILGSLSDRYGRRAVILTSTFGQSLNFVLMALAPNLAVLFLARLISGVTAGAGPAVNAYIADVAPPKDRAANFGWVAAANSAGFLLGPALGGLFGEIDPRLPFWVAAGLCMTNSLYGLLILPESLKKDRSKRLNWKLSNPASALGFLFTQPAVGSLALVLMMLAIAQQCLPTTIVLYTNFRFGWSAGQIGLYLTAVGVANMTLQALVLKRFVARFGERSAVMLGFSCYTIAFLVYATAPVPGMFVLGAPFFAFGTLVTPSVQAQITRLVAHDHQGRLQGALAAMTSLCGLVTPLVYTQIFALSIGEARSWLPPSAHMYLAATVLALGAILSMRYWRRMRNATVEGQEA